MKLAPQLANGMWIVAFVSASLACYADDEIRTYTIPKEHAPALAASAMPASDIPTADFKGSPIHWTAPAQWKTFAPTGIRLGNFEVTTNDKKAEIVVTCFPGAVGGELANVNRWRGELGLPEATQEQIVSAPVTVDGSDGKLYDFLGTARTLVASIFHEGNTWFFKMKGDSDLVGSQQPVFMDFLKTVKFSPSATVSQAESAAPISTDSPSNRRAGLAEAVNSRAALGADDPHAGLGLTTADTQSSSDLPKWNVPANWQEKTAGPMVLKSFSVSGGDDKSATVSISMFAGQGGGVLRNVQRWQGQMGLPPAQEADLPKVTQSVDVSGGKATLVDFVGADKSGQPARLVAAIVPHGGSTWFYKLLGDNSVVGREKNSFIQFVQSVQYP